MYPVSEIILVVQSTSYRSGIKGIKAFAAMCGLKKTTLALFALLLIYGRNYDDRKSWKDSLFVRDRHMLSLIDTI